MAQVRVRVSVLAIVVALGVLGVYAITNGMVEVATAVVGALAGIATRLVEGD